MEANELLRDQIFKTIKKQIRDNNPPEAKAAYDRLRNQGYDDLHTMQLIGQCLAVQLYNTLKYRKPFDNDRYVRNLTELPKAPYDNNE